MALRVVPIITASSQIMWATCVYIEAVSVFPQLRMMQNAKVRPSWLQAGSPCLPVRAQTCCELRLSGLQTLWWSCACTSSRSQLGVESKHCNYMAAGSTSTMLGSCLVVRQLLIAKRTSSPSLG